MLNRPLELAVSCLIFWGIATFLCGHPEMLFIDPDTGWHLAAGREILARGALPATNLWSFTAADHAWVNLAWLWDVKMASAQAASGWYGPVLLHSFSVAACLTLLYLACVTLSGNGLASFFAVFLIVPSVVLHLRPLWASNVLLAVLFLIAINVSRKRCSLYWWYAMPLLMPVWVNVHGAFIIAFVLLGAYGVEALVKRDTKIFAHLCIVGIMSIIGCFATPFGIQAVFEIVFSMLGKYSMQFTGEFMPSRLSAQFLLGQIYIPLFLAAWLLARVRPPLAEALLVIVFFILGCFSVRYWNFFFLFSAPLFARCLARFFSKNDEALPHRAALLHAAIMRRARAFSIAILAVFAATIAFALSPAGARIAGLSDLKPYAAYTPAFDFVKAHYPHKRFLNEFGLGGPMIEAGGIPVFMDGRVETAYPEQVIRDYFTLFNRSEGYEKLLKEYDVGGVVTLANPNGELSKIAQKAGWREVFNDTTLSVFVRK